MPPHSISFCYFKSKFYTKYFYDFHLHSCLSPHPATPGGDPPFASSGGVNPPCGEVFASAKTLGAPCGALRAIGTMPFCYPEKEFYMKYYYDLHLHSCLSPHPAQPGGGPFFLPRAE